MRNVAVDLTSELDVYASGCVISATSTTLVLDADAVAIDDEFNDFTVIITSGTGAGQSRTISDYVGATKTLTVSSAWDVTPDATSTFAVRELLTGTPTVASPTSGLTIDNETINTKQLNIGGVPVYAGLAVTYRVSGGTAGQTHEITVSCGTTASPAQTIKVIAPLTIV